MEQLIHVFGIDWKHLLFQIVNFGILFAALSYFLYKPLLNLMETRQKEIEEGVRAARDAEEDRLKAKAEHQALVTKGEKEAEAIVGRAVDEARGKESALLAEARQKEARILKDAEDRAVELARKIEQESRESVARAAVLAAEKLLRQELQK